MKSAPRSILIVLTGALGDVVRGCCVLQPLKKLFPETSIGWLVEKKWRSLLDNHPLINSIYEFDRSTGFRGALKVGKTLRKEKFDVVLDMQRTAKSGLFSFLSAAKIRVGFNPKDAKEYNWLFQNRWIFPVDPNQSKVLHYLEFIKALSDKVMQIDYENVDFGFQKKSFEKFTPQKLIEIDSSFIGILLGSTWSSKDWFVEGYIQAIEELMVPRANNHKIVLLGDKSKIKDADLIVRGLSDNVKPAVVNLAGLTNLLELAASLCRCKVVIGPDSGPGHLARALSIPYVSLFGPTDPRRVVPYQYDDLVVRTSIGCSPCLRRECPGLDRACMRLISPHTVFQTVDSVLSRTNQSILS